jgi:hypothetical protein
MNADCLRTEGQHLVPLKIFIKSIIIIIIIIIII